MLHRQSPGIFQRVEVETGSDGRVTGIRISRPCLHLRAEQEYQEQQAQERAYRRRGHGPFNPV